MHTMLRAGLVSALLLLAPMATAQAETADLTAIRTVIHAMFDRPDAALIIDPVVIRDGYAVAGWIQGGAGGRAFLRLADGNWTLLLCTGDEILSAEALRESGVPEGSAAILAAAISEAEDGIDPVHRKMLSSFQGIMRMDGN